MKYGAGIALSFSLLLAACAGGKTLTAEQACGCSDYFGATERPAWVDEGDQITALNYRSAGIANCTGVQTFDVEKSDLSARAKLSRMLAVQSDVRISETRKDYGIGPGYAQAEIEATQISQTLLQDSKITARWVDPKNCIIYAAAEISTANIEKQKAELARKQAARLVNKAFAVTAKSAPRAVLQTEARALLSKLGVTRLHQQDKNTWQYAFVLDFLTTERNDTALRGRLSAAIEDRNGTVVWSQTVKAKGVSFNRLSDTELTVRAIADGLDRMEAGLKTALMK